MKALLLCAGLGTRLRPLTNDIPKCLVPIHGRPLLDYWLQMLVEAGVRDILINSHHFADRVSAFVEQNRYRKHITLVYENDLLGTGGTVLRNKNFFSGEPILLVHADNLSVFDVQNFMRTHERRPQGCELTMLTYITPEPKTCGILELDGRGVVVGFHEKVANPPGNLANGAVYILEPSVVSFLESLKKENIDFSTEVIPVYIGRIATFHNGVYHRDIGTMDSYRLAETEFAHLQPD